MFLHRDLQHSIYPESLHIQNCPTPDTVSVCWLWGLPNACHILFFTVKDFEINPDIRRILKALGVAEFCNEFRDLLTKRERQTFESYRPVSPSSVVVPVFGTIRVYLSTSYGLAFWFLKINHYLLRVAIIDYVCCLLREMIVVAQRFLWSGRNSNTASSVS